MVFSTVLYHKWLMHVEKTVTCDCSDAFPLGQERIHFEGSNYVCFCFLAVRWRDPDLHEVIEFLNHPNAMVKANACAYLQHLCYMDNPVKQKTRALGGVGPLVQLLGHESPDVHRNACGVLRSVLGLFST
jgi:hypothetical protein